MTDFGGLFGPANSLGSPAALFDLAAWARNLLGAALCLGLLVAACTVVSYSYWSYNRSFRRDGKLLHPPEVIKTRFGKSMLSLEKETDLRKKPALRRVKFKILQETSCAPICCHLDGDPFAPSQRQVLIFVTLLAGLFFNVRTTTPSFRRPVTLLHTPVQKMLAQTCC